MITEIFIIRHAEAEGNYIRKFHGITDSNLTQKGYLQAQRLAQRLKNIHFDVIYSSPLKRAYFTAYEIAKDRGINIIKRNDLIEINGGDWEGIEWDKLPELWPEEYYCWENKPHEHCMPNGESMYELYQRAVNALNEITKSNEGKRICIVTHGTLIRSLLVYLKDLPFNKLNDIYWQDNTSINIVTYNGGKYILSLEGDSSHLGKDLSTFETQDWWKDFLSKREIND